MAKATVSVLTRINPATARKLERTVARLGMTKNDAVEQAIELWLEHQAATETTQ